MGILRRVDGAVGTVVLALLIRSALLRWRARDDEVRASLPGDALVPAADVVATRATSIAAPASAVWPWIVQMGQGRGGFYSYDVLENLARCDIHSADCIVPELQEVHPGDAFYLAPEVALRVALAEQDHALVVRSDPATAGMFPFEFSWAWVLRDDGDGRCRLVVRERYRFRNLAVRLLMEPVQLVSFVMTQKMLRGIRERAESSPVPTTLPRAA